MEKRRLLALSVAVVFSFVLFAGCGTKEEDSAEEVSTEPSPASTEEAAEPTEEPEATYDPAKIMKLSEEKAELSIWIATPMSIENNTESVNELTAIQKYEELTNVHINWQQASVVGAKEQFGVMIAGGEYPDIILALENYYIGGTTGAYEQGIIIALDDYLEEYMPNYSAKIKTDEAIKKEVVTDEGRYLAVYGFYDHEYHPLSGPMVRADWLEDLGLDVPVTYDDYYEVGLAFKTEFGCSDPILILGDGSFFAGGEYVPGYFAGGWGTPGFSSTSSGPGALGLYRVGNTVYSSLNQEGFKDYLMMLNKWYEAGVISRDFVTNPTNQMTPDFSSFIFNDKTGIFIGDAVNMVGYASNAVNPNFKLVGAPDPAVDESSGPSPFGIDRNRQQGSSACISTTCKNVELAMRWLDQWFSEEGVILANYGVEDLAHTLDSDGVRRYTDIVLNNEILTQQAATVLYTVIFCPTVNTQQTRFTMWEDQPATLDAVHTWTNSTTGEGILPGVTLNDEESELYSDKAVTIQTYASENIAQFINGDKSFDEWPSFQEQLLELGLLECIEVYQNALDRYERR